MYYIYTQAKFWSETFDPVLCHYGDIVLSNDQGKILYFVMVKVLLHKPENPKFGIWSHRKDAKNQLLRVVL